MYNISNTAISYNISRMDVTKLLFSRTKEIAGVKRLAREIRENIYSKKAPVYNLIRGEILKQQ